MLPLEQPSEIFVINVRKSRYLAILSISPLNVAIILLYLVSIAPMGSAFDSFSNLH